MAEEVERRLAAILSADAVGYSRLIADDEDATVHTITIYREQIAILIEEHHGRVVDFVGDNLLAEFRTARDAVICAIEIQRVLRARNASLPADHQMEFRMGIHLGDIRVEGGRIYGDGVNIAARIEALADAGGICISATVQEQVRHRISMDFVDLGEQSVKNIPEPVRVYRVLLYDAEQAEAPPESKQRSGGRLLALGAVSTAAVALVAAYLFWGGERQPVSSAPRALAALSPIRSIAVLPLQNLSGEPEQEFFVDGLTEELTAKLARIRALRVISRTSAMQYKNVHRPLPDIARELAVDGVIEGSVLLAGTKVRITAQLIHAEADKHLWAESYTRELTDVLALQSEVATAIVEAVKIKLTEAERRQLASSPRVDAGAHEAYLRGRFFLSKGTSEGREQAIRWFQTSVERDPDFALGYAGLADAYSCDRCPALPEETMVRAEAAARRALELDESLAEAHTALGVIKALHEWDFIGGEVELQRAMRLYPGYVRAHAMYARLLADMGRADEAVQHMEHAQSLDPLAVTIALDLGALYARVGRPVEALEQFGRALEIEPESPLAHQAIGRLECAEGRYDAAFVEFERAMQLSDRDPQVMGELGYCYTRAGRPDDARSLLADLEDGTLPEQAILSPALINVGLDDDDGAFVWLERAYEARATLLPAVLNDTRYARLHSDPRFADLLRRMGAQRTGAQL